MPTSAGTPETVLPTLGRIFAVLIILSFALVLVWYLLVASFGTYGEFLAILIVVIAVIFFILWLLNISYSHGYSASPYSHEDRTRK